VADKVTAALYTSAGEAIGEVTLDPAVVGIEPNVAGLHQVVTARSGTADTKTRGEVRGGGKKPWRQKGLGRARQGSTRSPQWRGGGTVFGPHPRSYRQRTPKKMRRLALRSALSARAAEGQVKVVESFDWAEPKTKQAVALLKAMEVSGKTLVVLGKGDEVAARSLGNLPQVVLTETGRLATYDVLWADTLIFTRETVGMAGGPVRFEVAADDFVREEGDGS
jgi:large subunit ribosomal protein L4